MLRAEPADVFSAEAVVVPARGVERWLAQQLSHELGAAAGDDGVCAGLRVMAPQSLISLLLGRDHDDPWHADRLVWPTLESIDELTGTTHFDALTHHLGAGPALEDPKAEWERRARQTRRYAVARRVAGLFASYARERPGLVADWEAGRDTDGQGRPLPPDFLWQPILWRRTVERVLERGEVTESVVARHRRVVEDLSGGGADIDLPARLSFFGYTRLAASELELLRALGRCRQVHLWLPHPSPRLWTDLAGVAHTGARADDTSAQRAGHPLLATLGRDIRELQAVLTVDGPIDHGPDTEEEATSHRLGLLQADIRANRAPDPSRRTPPGDLSIQVHACHGRARQVEVLREVLTWLIAEGKGGLQPRDILVMCPDIEEFAPLIQATFGLSLIPTPGGVRTAYHPGQQLRVRLADRSLGSVNPLIDLAHRVVALVAGRMTLSEVLDLAGHESVRARFEFDEEALDRIDLWTRESGVRWGYDAAHRGEYGLRDIDANTWTRAMDRMALGVAVAADTDGPSVARVPVDDVGSRDIETLGRFLEFVERLKVAADTVRGRGRAGGDLPAGTLTVAEWMRWLRTTIESLAATPDDKRWQLAQLARDLTGVADTAGEHTVLRLGDIRVLLEQRWGARPTRANFCTGAVTICTMVPMRSVPHKAIVVLGVDDGVYPRSPIVDGDDVLARRPMVGERDPRSEDRQLLLDAVMAAGDHFVAIYSGFDERTGGRRPPAVPLQELISAASRTATTEGAPAARADDEPAEPEFVRHHPLQAFDERNFHPDGPLPGGTFDQASLEGAKALRAFRARPSTRQIFLQSPLPAVDLDTTTLEQLVAFLQNPAREFLRSRLEVTVLYEADETDDSMPIALDGLEQWAIGERVLREVIAGVPLDDALDREAVRGSLPPGPLGDKTRADIAKNVATIVADEGGGPPRSVDVRVDLPRAKRGPVRVTGVVTGVRGDTLWVRTYSTIREKHVVAAWVRLLAVSIAEPDRVHTAQLMGKRGGLQLASPSATEAAALLADLTEVRRSGLRFPVGIPPRTASRYARAHRTAGARRDGDAGDAVRHCLDGARAEWQGDKFPGENADPWWRLVLGRDAPVEELNRQRGIEHFAPRVWDPIHAHGGEL